MISYRRENALQGAL